MTLLPELTSLRLLLAIEQVGSITEAARTVGLSQPAASKRVAALERALGVPLIERTTAGSRLTQQGRVAADWAGRVVGTVDQMLGAVASMRDHGVADLRLASSLTIAEHLVPGWISALRAKAPRLHVGLRVTNSQEVQRLVLDEQVDMGLVETSTVDGRLESRVIAHDRLAVVVAPTHPWARRGTPLGADELAAAHLIVREPGSGTRETLDRWLVKRAHAEPLLELGSNAAVKGAVRAGVGPAVLSVLAVQDELDSRHLVEVYVEGLDLNRALLAVWPRGREIDDSSARLLAIATELSGRPSRRTA